MENKQYISIDIMNQHTLDHPYAKQYDTGRELIFSVTENSCAFDLTGCTARIGIHKPDHTVVFNDGRISGNQVSILMTEQMTAVAGHQIPFELMLSDREKVFQTFTGYMVIEPSVIPQDAIVSTDEFLALTDALKRVNASQALHPAGTVTFLELPDITEAADGDMYNISDEFITTEQFREGAGHTIAAGANVYRTIDGFWDVLAGSSVTGVKGAAEDTYRQGNVDLTPEDLGAVPASGGSISGNLTVQGSILGAAVTAAPAMDSEKLLTAGGAYENLARLNASNTFLGSLSLNTGDASATTQRSLCINDYHAGEAPIGSTSADGVLRRWYATLNPANHYAYTGLHNVTGQYWESGFAFQQDKIVAMGARKTSDGSLEKVPTLHMNNGDITNVGAISVGTINGYKPGAACAKNVTTSAISGNENLITSGGAYTAMAGRLSTGGGTLTGQLTMKADVVPSGSHNLGAQKSNWNSVWTQSLKSGGTLKLSSGASSQAILCKGQDLRMLTYTSADDAASMTYAPVYASKFNTSSSRRYKDYVRDITDEDATALLALHPIVYDYKNKANGTNCEGLYAEDVYEEIPSAVTLAEIDGEMLPDSIDYSKLIPRMIRLLQMQQEEIQKLKEAIHEQ